MKKVVFLLFTFFLTVFSLQLYSQCTPDPGCVDDTVPGQICPAVLPQGTINVPYSQVMTIIPPATAVVSSQTVNIYKIVLTSINNLPPGITMQTDVANNTFMIYNVTNPKYCALLSGTPTDTGTYKLKIVTEVYINLFNNPLDAGAFTDSTSYFIKIISPGSGIIMADYRHFRIPTPANPFSFADKLQVISPYQQPISLKIFNCLGQKVYEENIKAVEGENYFQLNAGNLTDGLYIYSVSNANNTFNGRLVISKR
ncbi:MAG: T9SS type A sorting domain-containing protein [Bacteroidia bacterium]|nr:T9SS type A sorting domain-containing protein [Bacteroidia bacterium]